MPGCQGASTGPRSPNGQGSGHGTECDSPVPEGDILVPGMGIALCPNAWDGDILALASLCTPGKICLLRGQPCPSHVCHHQTVLVLDVM